MSCFLLLNAPRNTHLPTPLKREDRHQGAKHGGDDRRRVSYSHGRPAKQAQQLHQLRTRAVSGADLPPRGAQDMSADICIWQGEMCEMLFADQTNKGKRCILIPGARILKIVVIKLMAPKIEAAPER